MGVFASVPTAEEGGKNQINPNVTSSDPALRAYVRQEKYLSRDDPRYLQGVRKEPPLPEIAFDVFDRQRCIQGFNQPLVEKQTALVLGSGGIGMCVGLILARLGVDKLILVDKDVYEASNLTRQLLGRGTGEDNGKRKVDVAKENLERTHSLRSHIETHHMEALGNWPKIVAMAKRSNVIFNCMDIGTAYDYAINSLSKALSIPTCSGDSGSWFLNSFFYSGAPEHVCSACSGGLERGLKSVFKVQGADLDSLTRRVIEWATANTAAAATADGRLLVDDNQLLAFLYQERSYRIEGPTALSLIQQAIAKTHSEAQIDVKTQFGTFIGHYFALSWPLLLPSRVVHLNDLQFLPRPPGSVTREHGSWVCPCLGVSNCMVSQWANYLTGPTEKNPPINMCMNLASSDLAFEQPKLARDTCEDDCECCADVHWKLESNLIFSSTNVCLRAPREHDGESGTTHVFAVSEAAASRGSTGECYTEMREEKLWRKLDHLGPGYEHLVVDAVPSHDPAIPLVANGDISTLPLFLRKPLIKGSIGEGYVNALASGARSAVVRNEADGKWYRLKGVGMPDVGFTVVDVLNDNNEPVRTDGGLVLRKIRGSAYVHTCNIELSMSALIDELLILKHSSDASVVQMRVANKPIARWDYVLPHDTTEFPLVTRSCGIFETCGDRRLGEHVLRGIEMLLVHVMQDPATGLGSSAAVASAKEALRGTGANPNSTKADERRDVSPSELQEWDEYDARWPQTIMMYAEQINTSPTLYANLADPRTPLRGLSVPADDVLESIRDKSDKPFASSLKRIWQKNCRALRAYLEEQPASPSTSRRLTLGELVGNLYFLFGFETASFMRLLQEAELSWGSYSDKSGGHCNAHSNNMLLTMDQEPTSGEEGGAAADGIKKSFLAPLDFDMAYSKLSCRFGKSTRDEDLAMFENYFSTEPINLVFDLSMANPNAPSVNTGTKPPCQLPPDASLVRLALRDTITKGYLTSFQQQSTQHASMLYETENRKAAYAFLKLALCMSHDVVA